MVVVVAGGGGGATESSDEGATATVDAVAANMSLLNYIIKMNCLNYSPFWNMTMSAHSFVLWAL